MAGEVVGTAFVRIKALTTGLAKDIESQVKKSMKDADLDQIGEDAGDEFGERFAKEAGSRITGALGDSIDVDSNVGIRLGRGVADAASPSIRGGVATGIRSGVDDATTDDSGILSSFRRLGTRISSVLNQSIGAGSRRVNFVEQLLGRRRGATELQRIAKAFSKFNPLLAFAPLAAPIITGALQTLMQTLITMVGQLGFVSQAFVGMGVAGGFAFASVLAAIGPLALAFSTETPRLEAFREAATEVGDAWKEVGAATQRTLLPGLTRALRRSRDLIPIFAEYGEAIGQITSDLAEFSVEILRSDKAQDRFRRILDSSKDIFAAAGRIVLRFGDILSGIWVAAIPVTEQFAAAVERIVTSLQDSVNSGLEDGSLAATFQRLYDRAVLFFGALTDVAIALKNIFSIGADSTVPIFESFRTWAAEYRAFTESESGRNRIREIFDAALPVAREFFGLIGDIFGLLFQASFDPESADGLVGAIRNIRESLPGIAENLGGIVDGLREPLGNFAESLGQLFVAFQEANGLENLITILTGFTEALTVLLELPGFADFVGILLALTAAFKLMGALGIVGIAKALGSVLSVIGSTLAALTGIPAGTLAAVGALFVAVAAAVAKLEPVLAVVAGIVGVIVGIILGPLAAVMAVLGAAVGLVIRHFDTIRDAAKKAWAWTRPVREAIVKLLDEGLDRLTGTVSYLWNEILKPFAEWVSKKFPEGLRAIGRAVTFLWEDILLPFGQFLGKVFQPAFEQIQRFLEEIFGPAIEGLQVIFNTLQSKAIEPIAEFVDQHLTKFFERFGVVIGIVTTGLQFLLVEGFERVFNFLRDDFLPFMRDEFIPFMEERFGPTLQIIAQIFGETLGAALGKFFDSLIAVRDFIANEIVPTFVGFGASIERNVRDKVQLVIDKIREFHNNVLIPVFNFLRDNVPKILGTVNGNLAAFKLAIELIVKALSAVKSFIEDNIDAIDRLIDAVGRALSPLGKLADALSKIGNSGLLGIPGFFVDKLPGLGASGGIFSSATPMIIGEAGAEVLIPLTNPNRALELFNQSGLAKILASASGNRNPGSMSSFTPSSTVPATALFGQARSTPTFAAGAVQIDARGSNPAEIYDHFSARIGWEIGARGDE